MRIPFSQLRFTPGERQVWGVNFGRYVARRAEKSFAVIKPKAESGFQSRFPHLVGIEGVKARADRRAVALRDGEGGVPGAGPRAIPSTTARATRRPWAGTCAPAWAAT